MTKPDLAKSDVSKSDPPPAKLKIKLRKTPASVVTMKKHVNITPSPSAINLKDLVMDAPVQTAKPGEAIPKPSVPKISAPLKSTAGSTEGNAPETNVSKTKAAKYTPKILQTLASLPTTAPT